MIALILAMLLILAGFLAMSKSMERAYGLMVCRWMQPVDSFSITDAVKGMLLQMLLMRTHTSFNYRLGMLHMSKKSWLSAVPWVMGYPFATLLGLVFIQSISMYDLSKWSQYMVVIGGVAYFVLRSEMYRNHGLRLLGIGLFFWGLSLVQVSPSPMDSIRWGAMNITVFFTNPWWVFVLALLTTTLTRTTILAHVLCMMWMSVEAIELTTGMAAMLGALTGEGMYMILEHQPTDARLTQFQRCFGGLRWVVGLLCMFALLPLAEVFHSSYRLDVFSLLLFFVILHSILAVLVLGALPWLKQKNWWAVIPAQGLNEHGISHRYAVYPALALTYAKMHVTVMAQTAYSMLDEIMACFQDQAGQTIIWMDEQYDRMENRCRQMKFFLSRLNLEELSYRQTHLQSEFSQMNQTIKNLSSFTNRDVVELATQKKERGMAFSEDSIKSLTEYHQAIMENMLRTLDHLQTHNPDQAKAVTRNQKVLYSMGLALRQDHLQEIKDAKDPDLAVSSLYFALVAHLQVISISVSKLAYPSLDRRKDRSQ